MARFGGQNEEGCRGGVWFCRADRWQKRSLFVASREEVGEPIDRNKIEPRQSECEARPVGAFDLQATVGGGRLRYLHRRDGVGRQLEECCPLLLRAVVDAGFLVVDLLSRQWSRFRIGANTAIFQLINAIQLKHLPIPDPQELVEVKIAGGSPNFGLYSSWTGATITNPLWEQIRERQSTLSEIFAWGADKIIIDRGADAKSVDLIWVSGGLFPALRLHPEFGRLFNSDDDRRGCEPRGVIISYTFWRNYFRGEGSAIGKTLILGEKTFTVIGLTPPDFHGLEVGDDFDVACLFASAQFGIML